MTLKPHPQEASACPQLLKGNALNQQVRARFGTWSRSPWRKWFKNLLACVIRAYAPTLDGKWAVAKLESWWRPGAPKPKPDLEQEARLWGHVAAFLDYHRERRLKQSQSDAQKEGDYLGGILRELPDGLTWLREQAQGMPFHDRAAFMRHSADAYGRTFTPLGERMGDTTATEIHKYLLAWFMVSVGLRCQPRTVRELLEWTWHRNPALRPKLRADGTDPWEQEIQRVQKLFERLGFSLGGHAKKPRQQRRKRMSTDKLC